MFLLVMFDIVHGERPTRNMSNAEFQKFETTRLLSFSLSDIETNNLLRTTFDGYDDIEYYLLRSDYKSVDGEGVFQLSP